MKASSWVCSWVRLVARGWRISQRLRVWWKRSTLPQVDLDDAQAVQL